MPIHIDIVKWVEAIGYIGIFLIIFLETGLFLGFFLPGDSLLFAAGLLASQNIFNIWILVPLLIVVACGGYFLAYWFGEKLGNWLLKRKDSIWFKKSYLIEARKFYEKHGGKALVLGRLVRILRTFVPIVAGMANMRYRTYVIFNIIGGLVWAGGVTLLGYYLGSVIPDAGRYILPIVLVVILISFVPGVWHYFKRRSAAKQGRD